MEEKMNKPVNIKHGMDAKIAIKEGIDIVARTVESTLGSSGQFVIIDHENMHPQVTNDGVTVAKAIYLKDPFANLGAKIIKEVATKTNSDSGDGTTTATLLAQRMISNGMKHLLASSNPMKIKQGIEIAVKQVVQELAEQSKTVKGIDDIRQIAIISANDTELGTLIADAYNKVGKEGIVLIEEGRDSKTVVELIEGMSFERGWLSSYFYNKVNGNCEFEDVDILIINEKVDSINSIIDLLNKILIHARPLLIIVNDLEGDALGSIVLTKMNKGLPVCAVKCPWFGDRQKDILEDIAAATGATILGKHLGHNNLNKLEASVVGHAKKVIVSKESTVIVTDDKPELKAKVQERIDSINIRINEALGEFDKDKERERLGKLTGGLAVIKAGGTTDSEMLARKYKIEDAVNAVRSAVQEGVIPGGGYILAKIAKEYIYDRNMESEVMAGCKIVIDALSEPMKQIANNAGYVGEVVLNESMTKNMLFNAKSGQYELPCETTVIDPKKVARTAIENAASITITFLTTNALMTDEPDEVKK
jgi:chaperonin GroEL